MGREAVVYAQVGTEAGEVKALLESRELILRGDIRRHYPKSSIQNIELDGEALRFHCAGESVSLELGGKLAKNWAKAITTPPPSLRAKLGLDKGATAFLIGVCDDAELAEALDGSLTNKVAEAAILIARIDGPGDLELARTVQANAPDLPVWTIYPKGNRSNFGESAVRSALRDAGLRDTKSCAVSDQLTATRFNPVTAAKP